MADARNGADRLTGIFEWLAQLCVYIFEAGILCFTY